MAVPTPRLRVQTVPFSALLNNDAGSGADKNLASWKPDKRFVHFGWYYLGPAATNGSNDAYGLVVNEIVPGTLGQVNDWVQVWSDAGSGNGTDFSLWRGIPDNPAHVVLGGIFVRSHNKPTIDESRYIRTIDKDMLVTAKATPEIWNDMGSGARADGAVWGISTAGNTKAINTGAFIPVQGYNNPPGVAYALDSTKVTVVGQENDVDVQDP
ncbi:hypothetical protein PILCRDRAFT_97217 [Piloderma croceum F 1598]|uniref:DUF946 domain-containing protein n=1 Tax=Piloderma croceum (strain F 1598) TaxID=765440 RepID=A0A0C3FYN5_PILCF|nr:hypothetical protein PILCRDRAFT_97217 [Piloderma croceum F 1598]